MRHLRSAAAGITVIGLLYLTACTFSGTPRGSFPGKAGDFTLVEGPVAQKEDKANNYSAHFLGEYRLSGGVSVSHMVMPFSTAEQAGKEFADRKEAAKYDPPGFMAYESGGKLVRVDPGGTTTVTWAVNNWYCSTSSKTGDAAIKLAESLAYK